MNRGRPLAALAATSLSGRARPMAVLFSSVAAKVHVSGSAVMATVATAVLALWWRRGPHRHWRPMYVRLQQRFLALSMRTTSSFRLLRDGCLCRIISDRLEAEEVLRCWLDGALSGRLLPVFGLDVEWVRGRPASLLQLSCGSECLVLRLSQMAIPPPALQLLLHEDRVLKVGVGVHHDMERLESWLRIAAPRDRTLDTAPPPSARGGVDIAPLALSVCGPGGLGLSQIAWRVLGVRVDKSAPVRCSDWEQPTLSREQAEYAAQDANLPLQVLRQLHRQADSPLSLYDWAAEASHRQASARAAGAARRQARTGGRAVRGGAGAESGCGGVAHRVHRQGTGGMATTERRKPFGHAARSAPLYDGWLMISPQGDTMARLNESRARWYVARGLATANEEQRSISLTFKPAGLGNAAEPWLVQPKANACVGCGISQAEASVSGHRGSAGLRPDFHTAQKAQEQIGGKAGQNVAETAREKAGRAAAETTGGADAAREGGCAAESQASAGEDPTCLRDCSADAARDAAGAVREGAATAPAAAGLIRWSVLPHSLRRLLPVDHKAHDSHDIVLLCSRCHRRVEAPYTVWRRQLLEAHGVPLGTARYIEDRQAAKVSYRG